MSEYDMVSSSMIMTSCDFKAKSVVSLELPAAETFRIDILKYTHTFASEQEPSRYRGCIYKNMICVITAVMLFAILKTYHFE